MGRLRRVALGLNDKLSSPSLKTLRLMYIRNCPRLAFDKLGVRPKMPTIEFRQAFEDAIRCHGQSEAWYLHINTYILSHETDTTMEIVRSSERKFDFKLGGHDHSHSHSWFGINCCGNATIRDAKSWGLSEEKWYGRKRTPYIQPSATYYHCAKVSIRSLI